ncbi:MAG: hypothetical protein KDA88_07630 [Planctomycetaceae bacterium]|nr:hypothetical protein [Planctomycetaceae bacterium]MCB9949519.1 hypothetical protein [Planctomycetaceae bacterium]
MSHLPEDFELPEPEEIFESIENSDGSDFEEISSDEVDRVIEMLEAIIEDTQSENIRAYLDEAAENIYRLVYDDESEEWESDSEISDAA